MHKKSIKKQPKVTQKIQKNKNGQKNHNVLEKNENDQKNEKNDSTSTSNVNHNVYNMFKALPQSKFKLKSKETLTDCGTASLKTHFEVQRKNLEKEKEAKKIKPSAGKQIDLIIEKNKKNIFEKEKIKNTKPENSQHPPPKKTSELSTEKKHLLCGGDYLVRDKKNTPLRDKKNTPVECVHGLDTIRDKKIPLIQSLRDTIISRISRLKSSWTCIWAMGRASPPTPPAGTP